MNGRGGRRGTLAQANLVAFMHLARSDLKGATPVCRAPVASTHREDWINGGMVGALDPCTGRYTGWAIAVAAH